MTFLLLRTLVQVEGQGVLHLRGTLPGSAVPGLRFHTAAGPLDTVRHGALQEVSVWAAMMASLSLHSLPDATPPLSSCHAVPRETVEEGACRCPCCNCILFWSHSGLACPLPPSSWAATPAIASTQGH